MEDLYESFTEDEPWMKAVKEEFVGQNVLTNYGNKRAYKVDDIVFGLNLQEQMFQPSRNSEEKISLMDYFRNQYGLHLKQAC